MCCNDFCNVTAELTFIFNFADLTMPQYKLHYFNSRGRAEVARYIFAYAKIDYEDMRYEKEQWLEFKPSKRVSLNSFNKSDCFQQEEANQNISFRTSVYRKVVECCSVPD